MKLLTFSIIFYILTSVILGLINSGGMIDLNCDINKNPNDFSIPDEVNSVSFISSSFNAILFLSTLGFTSDCDFPAYIRALLFIYPSLIAISIIYLLRGTN